MTPTTSKPSTLTTNIPQPESVVSRWLQDHGYSPRSSQGKTRNFRHGKTEETISFEVGAEGIVSVQTLKTLFSRVNARQFHHSPGGQAERDEGKAQTAALLRQLQQEGFEFVTAKKGRDKTSVAMQLVHPEYELAYAVALPKDSAANLRTYAKALSDAAVYRAPASQAAIDALSPLVQEILSQRMHKRPHTILHKDVVKAALWAKAEAIIVALKKHPDLRTTENVIANSPRCVEVFDLKGREGLPDTLGTATDKPMMFPTNADRSFPKRTVERLELLLRSVLVRNGENPDTCPALMPEGAIQDSLAEGRIDTPSQSRER